MNAPAQPTAFNRAIACFALCHLAALTAAAQPLKVDLGANTGRSDTAAPGFIEWQFNPEEPSRTFGRVTVRIRAAGREGSRVHGEWYKPGLIHPAAMACDGVFVMDGGQLEMVIAGLPPGQHTIATYHNSLWPAARPLSAFSIHVNDALAVSNVQHSIQVTNDYDAASAHVRVEAVAGEDVVLRFSPEPASAPAGSRVILNGFEIDTGNPAARAIKPSPVDGNEHVDADNGSVILTWTAAPSARSHDVYFGTSEHEVTAAGRTSPAFQGNQETTEWRASGLNNHTGYYWRVDTLDSTNGVTLGEVWRFQPRHLAFPGAEGHGRFARGGRGGRVLIVNNLNDSGPGSLRAAVEAEGPRTVVFNVSGLITLESKLIIRNPHLTLAGQTAPGKGICVRKFNLGMLGTHDVIMRHLRLRPGNIADATLDGTGMASSDHCIMDHCSISWSIDEGFSSRSAKNITLQRTLISEALNAAGHSKYPPGKQHGYAASISGRIGSFHHNLLAHCAGRNWSLAGGLNHANRHAGWLDIRNNVVFNWRHRTTDGGAAKVNFVNNYYRPGPATIFLHYLNPERNNIAGFGPQDYYVSGNALEGHCEADAPLSCGVTEPEPRANFIVPEPFFESHVETRTARAALKHVLSDVGCNQPRLDDHDSRVIRETLTGTARYAGSRTGLPGLPDSQEDVGGWEDYPEVRRASDWDSDLDGLPDWWEILHQLNPRSPDGDFSDSNADPDGDGYTQLEDYLNWMASPRLECERNGTVELNLARLTRGFTLQPAHTVSTATNGTVSLLPDGTTARFAPESDFTGLAAFRFTVIDAEGDAMTREVGIRVRAIAPANN